MPKTKRKLIVHISDEHSGHKLGLCNPETILQDEDGNKVDIKLSANQEFLWDLQLENTERLNTLNDKHTDVIIIHTGEPAHGNKHPQYLMSNRMSDQIDISVNNYVPLFKIKNLKMMRYSIGTDAHTFGEGAAEILVTRRLEEKYKNVDIRALYHGILDIDGFEIDYAHHGPFYGSRAWLKGNVARYYLQSLMIKNISKGNKPSNLVLRGHYHTPLVEDVRINGHKATIVIGPSMCFMDSYARRATRSDYDLSVGWMVYELVDGKLVEIYDKDFIRTIDIRTREKYG